MRINYVRTLTSIALFAALTMRTNPASSTKRAIFFVIDKVYTLTREVSRAGSPCSRSGTKTAFSRSFASSAFSALVANRAFFGIVTWRSFVNFRVASNKKRSANGKNPKNSFHIHAS
jgi:hypothetical protein